LVARKRIISTFQVLLVERDKLAGGNSSGPQSPLLCASGEPKEICHCSNVEETIR
jgi:hypothetical protein